MRSSHPSLLAGMVALFASNHAYADDAPTQAPPDRAAAAPSEKTAARPVPIQGWSEMVLGCRVLTTFASAVPGCELAYKAGETIYFNAGAGFFGTPTTTRAVRSATTLEDETSSTVWYASGGPGYAWWLSRQVRLHFEISAIAGYLLTPESSKLAVEKSSGFALSGSAGAGASYRLRSLPWAFAVDYRFQGVPHRPLGADPEVTASGAQVEQTSFGFAQSIGLSIILRTEHDRSN